MASRTIEELVAASAAWRSPERPDYLSVLKTRALGAGAVCRWCGGLDTLKLQADVSRYGEASFDVWECLICTARFTDHAPLPAVDYEGVARRHAWYRLHDCDARHVAAILEQGPEHFWTSMAARYLADIPWFPDRRYRACLAALIDAHRQGRRLRVLEIGCGRGVIGAIASRLGHAYLGLDVISEQQAHSLERFRRYGAVYRAIDPNHDSEVEGRYDLVFSSEVIEHVAQPLAFFRRVLTALDENGALIMTTPDLDLSRHLVWGSDRPPIHTVFLSRRAIELATARIGAPGRLRIHNENNAFDGSGMVAGDAPASPTLEALAPVQLQPDHDGFAYAVENLDWGRPRLNVFESPDQVARDYQAQTLRAVVENARILAGSMIVTFVRASATAD